MTPRLSSLLYLRGGGVLGMPLSVPPFDLVASDAASCMLTTVFTQFQFDDVIGSDIDLRFRVFCAWHLSRFGSFHGTPTTIPKGSFQRVSDQHCIKGSVHHCLLPCVRVIDESLMSHPLRCCFCYSRTLMSCTDPLRMGGRCTPAMSFRGR